MPPALTPKEIQDAFSHADWCVRTLMPLVLELTGKQQRWADQLRVLREVRDDASAAAALAVFSKLMRSYPDEKWATDGWWALQYAGKTLERREDAASCRRALGQALSFARDTWLHAESQRWTAKAAKAKAVYEMLKAAQI